MAAIAAGDGFGAESRRLAQRMGGRCQVGLDEQVEEDSGRVQP
jgi:hypothetical protein